MHLPRKVRPRWVWAGTLMIIAAMVMIGIANVAGSTTWQLIGVVFLVVGAAGAFVGGVMRSVHGSVAEDPDGSADARPGELVHDPRVVTETDTRPRPSLRPRRSDLGSASLAGLVVVAVWLVLSRTILGVPFEPQTSSASLRDVLVAVVLVLSAVLLHQHGPSRVASGVCAVCGLLLVIVSLTASYAVDRQMVSELVSGVAIVLFAAGTLLRPRLPDAL